MWVDVIEVRWRKRNLGGGLSVGLLDKAARKPIGLSTSVPVSCLLSGVSLATSA